MDYLVDQILYAMDEFEEAQIKDRLIRILLNDLDNVYGVVPLYNELLHPNYSVQHLRRLIDEIIAYDNHLISLRRTRPDYAIMGLATSREFLDNGGFVALYEEEQANARRETLEREQRENDLAIQRRKDRNQGTLAQWKIYTFWPVFILGIFGGGYSIYQILSPREYVTKEQMDEKFEKERDSLHNVLELLKTTKDTIE